MTRTKEELWERFKKYYTEFPAVGLAMDLSRVNFGDDYFQAMAGGIQKAFAAMAELENGAIANPDEKRMVGHYWLRNPALAPKKEIRAEIEETVASIKAFAVQATPAYWHWRLGVGPTIRCARIGKPSHRQAGTFLF